MIRVIESILHSTEHHHTCTTFVLRLPVVHLPVAFADHMRGNLRSGCLYSDMAKDAGLPVVNKPCPHINAELLVVSRIDCTMRILLCPLVLVVNIDDVSSERCVVSKERQ
jgi:hypothetical protein